MDDALTALFSDWDSQGRKPQSGFKWRKESRAWQTYLPRWEAFIDSLPSEISRDTVRVLFKSKSISITEKFLTTMIWGYADVGYGPYRVSLMLGSYDLEANLKQVELLCESDKYSDAYEFLKHCRIRQLGPSFASKFIFFLSDSDPGTPVLDSLVGQWLSINESQSFGAFNLKIDRWDSLLYEHYVEWARSRASRLGINAGELESLIFSSIYR